MSLFDIYKAKKLGAGAGSLFDSVAGKKMSPSESFNKWDEEWEQGGISTANGQNTSTDGYYRSKNYVPVLPSTTYYMKTPTSMMIIFYDEEKNFKVGDLSEGNNAPFITKADTKYLRFRNATANAWTPYNNDICINISGSRNGEYQPYGHK